MLNKEEREELTRIFGDPIEFLKYVKIQEPGELSLKYELWSHLVPFNLALEVEKLLILIKTKQASASWTLAARALRKIYTIPGFNVLEFSSGEKEAQKLLAKSKIIYQNLPEWMQVYTLEPDSTERFGFKEMRSVISAFPSTEKAGIGETAGLVIHDEADFHDFFEVNLGHTLATIADDPSRQLIAVTTVDKTKPDSYFKRLFKGARGSGYPEAGSNSFQALFWAYNVRPGRDKAFLEEQNKINEATPWVVEANYPRTVQEALSPLSAQSCFNKDKLNKLWDNAKEPDIRQGFIYILCPPMVGTQYVGGVDVGEGLGQDYSCLSIVGKQGLMSEVVAVIYINTLGTDSFAFEVDRLCKEYFDPLLVVDNIGVGRAVVDTLVKLGRPNLFSSEAEEKKRRGVKITGAEKVGFTLTRPNKRELVVKLVERINNGSLITRFKPMIKELMEYQMVNGYPEPTGRTHGDTVISLMLAGAVLDRVGPTEKAKLFVGGRQVW